MRHCKIHQQITNLLGANFSQKVEELYKNNFSGQEIADYIKEQTEISITPRSIQRTIKKIGISRDTKTAFNNAIQRGRVQWAYKSTKYKRYKLNPKTRYQILTRDNFKCVKCGQTAQTTILEVDHIKPLCKGGLSTPDNLQTLCYKCNKGKQLAQKEQ